MVIGSLPSLGYSPLAILLTHSTLDYSSISLTMPGNPSPNSQADPEPRERTRVACRRCNSKVKCNAEHGMPCKGCVSAKTDCVLIESQRGRYARQKLRNKDHRRLSTTRVVGACRSLDSRTASITNTARSEGNGTANAVEDVVENSRPVPLDPPSFSLLPEDRISKTFETAAPDCDGRFYLHIADQGVSSTQQPISNQKSTLFLGEYFSLTYAVHDVLASLLSTERGPSYQKRLHFPIAEGFDPSDRGRQDIVQAQTQLLQKRNLYFQPSHRVLERLLIRYFQWFHPAFPVLERPGFLQKCGDSQTSLLLLNDVLMIAVTICDASDPAILGLSDLYEARELFYRQARELYESDSDLDKINNVVAIFLMSFW